MQNFMQNFHNAIDSKNIEKDTKWLYVKHNVILAIPIPVRSDYYNNYNEYTYWDALLQIPKL